MTQYEQILNKISPTFYKTLQYHDYYSYGIIWSYFVKKGFYISSFVHLPIKNTHYYYTIYYSSDFIKGNITLTTIKSKHSVDLAELIINMVINKFSFENEQIEEASNRVSFKNAFIAAVGKDMYETIRENIK